MRKKEIWLLVDEVNRKLKRHKITVTFTPYPKVEVWEVKGGEKKENILVTRFKTTMWQATKFVGFIEKLIGGENES